MISLLKIFTNEASLKLKSLVKTYLNVIVKIDCWINASKDEISVVGQPTHTENDHNKQQHLYHLETNILFYFNNLRSNFST